MSLVIDYYSPHDKSVMECWKISGVTGIARYLTNSPSDPRQITPQEVSDAHSLGFSVHFFYEMNPTYPEYFTYAQGAEDCRQAIDRLRELGAPEGTVVYFAVDTNIEPSLVNEYFNGVESMKTPQITPGAYGFQRFCEYARANYPNIGKHLAQTYGIITGTLDLWQHEQEALCGVAVDLNECTVEGWKEMNDQEFKDMFDRVIGPALEAEILERMAKATKDAIEQHYHATSIGEFAPREARPQ